MSKLVAVAVPILVALEMALGAAGRGPDAAEMGQVGPASSQATAAAQPTRFAGTWVGTQRWAIANPPPGSRQDQPVTLTIEVVDGKITGTLKPFLGGEDGATIVDAKIVGEELQATAVVGRPRPGAVVLPPPAGRDAGAAAQTGRRGGANPGWKESTRIDLVFHNEGLQGIDLVGTADVTMSGVPWMKFKYELAKKRARY